MKHLASIVAGVAIAIWAFNATPYDSTDDRANDERSGMRLFTDHMTGCQYLQAGMFGGMVPRWNKDGGHVGCER